MSYRLKYFLKVRRNIVSYSLLKVSSEVHQPGSGILYGQSKSKDFLKFYFCMDQTHFNTHLYITND